MAVFRAVLAVIPRVRQGLNKAADFIKKIYKRIAKVVWLIRAILLWNSIIKRTDNFLRILRIFIRRLRVIPIPQIKVVLTALDRLIKSIRTAIRPMRQFLQQANRPLRRINRILKIIRDELKTGRSTIRSLGRRLLVMQGLAAILEKQQDFIESVIGERLRAMLYRLVGNLENLAKELERIVKAAMILEAALGAILSAMEPFVRQVQSFIDGLKTVLDYLNPLRNALQKLLNGLNKLMQNTIVKLIIDGFTWLMDKLEALFNALLDKIGLNALIDRIIQSIPGMQQLLNALRMLTAKFDELLEKLDQIKEEVSNIRRKLDEILAVVENIISLLRGLLAYKALVELQLPEFISLTKNLPPDIKVKDYLKLQNEILDEMEKNDEFSQEIAQINDRLKQIDNLLDAISNNPAEEEMTIVMNRLRELIPDEDFSYKTKEGEQDLGFIIIDAIKEEALLLDSLLKNNPELTIEDKKHLAEGVSLINQTD